MPTGSYRVFIPNHDDGRLTQIRGLDPHAYREWARKDPFAGGVLAGWSELYPGAFTGITADGTVIGGLFPLREVPADEAAPTAAMVSAANDLIGLLSPDEAARIRYQIDAPEWRSWSNPEFMIHDTGMRLEFLAVPVREAVLGLLRASLSDSGYQQVRTLMRINAFLGELVDAPAVMNEFSYHVALYGDPSPTQPWGWQLFGHHIALNCYVQGPRYALTPAFLGAEPNLIDDGPYQGATAFIGRIAAARALTEALTEALSDGQRAAVQVYPDLVTGLPAGRVHPGDERHLGGAFEDNRVVPYEGARVADWPQRPRELLLDLVAESLTHLPAGPARARLRQVREHLGDTWFAWYGGFGPDDPFYYRIQSPVAMFELDHHCGVFLTNTSPAAFHIHTVERTPNGNDYGRSWLDQWRHGRES
jgi:hypothetical protein